VSEKGNPPMTASNKTLLVVSLLLASALSVSACSSLVTVDRSKVPDEMYVMPKPDAGQDEEDAGK
jgi:hypothetical protein